MSHNRASAAVSEVVTESAPSDDNDLLWGGKSIAASINRTPTQFYYLYEKGVLKGGVARSGHKTFVASRKLRALLPR